MSKEKSPQEKKASSLEHDRRNTFGENPTSSRKISQRESRLGSSACVMPSLKI